MLFKILHGDPSNISLDITPFHEGWAYVTHDGFFYIDLNVGTVEVPNNQRIKLNAASAEMIDGLTLDEIKSYIDDVVVNAGGNIELDTTLTQSGVAADAKAVGDRLIAMDVATKQYVDSQLNNFMTAEEIKAYIDSYINTTMASKEW